MHFRLAGVGQRWQLVFTWIAHLLLFSTIGAWFADLLPVANDNLNLSLPYRVLLDREFHTGGFPFWDLYTAGGMPLHSVYMASLLNPVVVITTLLPIPATSALVMEIYLYSLIGVTGMWVWLGKGIQPVLRSVLSLAWSNTLFMVAQSHLNMEVVVTTSMLPWIMIGLTRLSGNRSLRASILGCSLVLMLTSGYLGMAPFLLYGVGVYLIVSFVAESGIRGWISAREVNFTRFGFKAVELSVVAMLVLGALSIAVSETLHNLSSEVFFERSVDPFQGSLEWKSVVSVVSLENPIFLPVVVIAGLAWGPFTGRARYWAGLVAGLFTFAISLSPTAPWSRLVVSALPMLEDVRFHGFSTGIALFFLTTAAAEGLRTTKVMAGRKLLVFLVVLGGLGLLANWVDESLVDGASAIYLLVGGAMVAFLVSPIQGTSRHVVLGLVGIFAVAQVFSASQHLVLPLLEENNELRQRSIEAIRDAQSEPTKPVPQVRDLKYNNVEQYGSMLNSHLLPGVPTLDAYAPHVFPPMQAVIDQWKDERVERLRRLLLGEGYESIEYEVVEFGADEATFRVGSESTDRWITVTTPFADGWNATTIRGDDLSIRPSIDQLLEVQVPRETSTFIIEYEPRGLRPLVVVTGFSWLSLLTLFVLGLRKELRSQHNRSQAEQAH